MGRLVVLAGLSWSGRPRWLVSNAVGWAMGWEDVWVTGRIVSWRLGWQGAWASFKEARRAGVWLRLVLLLGEWGVGTGTLRLILGRGIGVLDEGSGWMGGALGLGCVG